MPKVGKLEISCVKLFVLHDFWLSVDREIVVHDLVIVPTVFLWKYPVVPNKIRYSNSIVIVQSYRFLGSSFIFNRISFARLFFIVIPGARAPTIEPVGADSRLATLLKISWQAQDDDDDEKTLKQRERTLIRSKCLFYWPRQLIFGPGIKHR